MVKVGLRVRLRAKAYESRAHHGARESALGRAAHPRRVAQARVRRFTAHGVSADAPSPKAALADLAHVPRESPRRPSSRSTSSSCRPRLSEFSTCSWSSSIIVGGSCTSTSRTPRLPRGPLSKSSRRSPMTRRRAISFAIAKAFTGASFDDGCGRGLHAGALRRSGGTVASRCRE
jgi:hypothetical protein